MKKNVLKMFTACAAVCLTAGLVAVSGGNDAKADEPFSVEYNFEDDSYKQDDIFNLGITTEVVEGINSDVGSREFGEAVSTGNKCLKITNRASGKKWWEQNGFAYDLKKLTPGVSYDIKVDVYHENGAVADKDYTALRPFKIGTRYEGADAGNDTDHPKNYSQIGNKKGADTKTWERLEGTIKIPEGIDDYATAGDYFLYIFMAYPEAIGSGSQQGGYSDKNAEDYYIDNFSIKPHVDATPAPTPTKEAEATPAAATATPIPTPAAPSATPIVYVDDDIWMEKGYEETTRGITYAVTGEGTVEVKKADDIKKAVIPATVVIEEGTYKVTAIANNAFKGNTDLKQVTIGANVTKIGKNAFFGCKKLKKITVKSNVIKSIGAKAFKKVNAKATVSVPKAKKAAYKKLFKKAGMPAKAKIK